MAKPFLKWVGGKTQLLPELRKRMPMEFNRYYEPFLGGGALFFDLADEIGAGRAFLGDSCRDLIVAYRAVKDRPQALAKTLDLIAKDEIKYYDVRDAWLPSAARTVYLNKLCFNGLWRTNKAGKFNVSYGKNSNRALYDLENLLECSRALQGAEIDCVNYVSLAVCADKGDFVYFDPPYIKLARTSFSSYGLDAFGIAEHANLAGLARSLRDRGVCVMISNSNTDVTRDLYKGFHISEVRARRSINADASGRGKVKELIIAGENYR